MEWQHYYLFEGLISYVPGANTIKSALLPCSVDTFFSLLEEKTQRLPAMSWPASLILALLAFLAAVPPSTLAVLSLYRLFRRHFSTAYTLLRLYYVYNSLKLPPF